MVSVSVMTVRVRVRHTRQCILALKILSKWGVSRDCRSRAVKVLVFIVAFFSRVVRVKNR